MASRTTGPILVAGGVTWLNQTVLLDSAQKGQYAETTVRIGVATGLLAAAMYGLERLIPEIAVGLAYTMLVTSLIVRFNNNPTPLERVLEAAT